MTPIPLDEAAKFVELSFMAAFRSPSCGVMVAVDDGDVVGDDSEADGVLVAEANGDKDEEANGDKDEEANSDDVVVVVTEGVLVGVVVVVLVVVGDVVSVLVGVDEVVAVVVIVDEADGVLVTESDGSPVALGHAVLVGEEDGDFV